MLTGIPQIDIPLELSGVVLWIWIASKLDIKFRR